MIKPEIINKNYSDGIHLIKEFEKDKKVTPDEAKILTNYLTSIYTSSYFYYSLNSFSKKVTNRFTYSIWKFNNKISKMLDNILFEE